MDKWTLHAQGDCSLVIVLGHTRSVSLSRRCIQLADRLRAAALEGVTDVVPSFTRVTLHGIPDLDWMQASARSAAPVIEATLSEDLPDAPARVIEIPVCYGGDLGPDLNTVATHAGLDVDGLIQAHTAQTAWVLMLGFAPGSPYLGLYDTGLDIPRRATPRTHVPAGSVAVAARQTIVYPKTSPGGWHIIGRTPIHLFDATAASPSYLQPGDAVRFTAISVDTFRSMGSDPA